MGSNRVGKGLAILVVLWALLLAVGHTYSKSDDKVGRGASIGKEHQKGSEVSPIKTNRIELTDRAGKTAVVLEVSPEGKLRLGVNKPEDGIEICRLFSVPHFEKGVQDGWKTDLTCHAEQWWWWEGVRPLR